MDGKPPNNLAIGICLTYNVRVHLEWDTRTTDVQLLVYEADTLRERRAYQAHCDVLPDSTPETEWLNALTVSMLRLVDIDGPVTLFLGDIGALAKFVALWGDYEWDLVVDSTKNGEPHV
ncbi:MULTISPECIES: hypothetical protein [unclassified Streptomyces]|uniref:hypothetical protein n=1 Tax=unclassified Streptomyces TaxID=2593676 RepID=UPI00081F21EB|nr:MULTISPECIES: hypothetical protein [unclassified Streptomyces]MYR95480.1 hypothetical protein [Streptomyces sp. SID4937]SCD91121.1 hypothetical protein GA0115243_104766 [Streptomyces sp. ScaeMP-e83]